MKTPMLYQDPDFSAAAFHRIHDRELPLLLERRASRRRLARMLFITATIIATFLLTSCQVSIDTNPAQLGLAAFVLLGLTLWNGLLTYIAHRHNEEIIEIQRNQVKAAMLAALEGEDPKNLIHEHGTAQPLTH